ncbi:DNA-binding response regulator [Mycolicibacterium wolinskyi]|uniref:response regulator transcription factor n=1 Tax=Mycolicibacterium wolinskyi TaxID=59750 RepID=UPI000A047A3E|nr:response regulator transcription factor [Mycolicibacterium wolinskyi]
MTIAAGGTGALLAIVAKAQPQMIIVEVGASVADTMSLCRYLRSVSDAHIAVLTAGHDAQTTIAGFDAGADEVFAEPLRTGEIACRVRTFIGHRHRGSVQRSLGRAPEESDGPRRFGPLTIDADRRQVFVSGRQIDLTRTQFDILATLARNPDRLTTRQELQNAVWGPSWSGSSNNIDVHIGHLRRKLGDDPAHPTLVLNVRGVGYRLPMSH